MKTLTAKQFKELYGDDVYSGFGDETKKPNYFQRVGQGIKETFTGLGKDIRTQAETIAEEGIQEDPSRIKQAVAFGRGGLRTAGAVAKTALTPITEAPGIKQASEFVGEKLAGTAPIKKFAEWSERHPEAAKDIMNTLDIGALFGAKTAAKPLIKGVKAVAKETGQVAERIGAKAAGATKPIQQFAQPLYQEAKRIPERISTNVAQKQAVQQTIDKLPTKAARQAAQDGLDVVDVKKLYQLPKSQKGSFKKLATVVKDFAEGKTKTNPIEVVGKPIVNRLKELEKSRGTVGQKLGQAADKLGRVSSKELDDAVFKELKQVSGLNGLKKTRLGDLDFSNTTLATDLSQSDRVAIKKIFSIATKSGTGKSKHLIRQELFEILGGKKRALTNITDTQEKAFQAVRKGLSNVLESKNPTYKALSGEYRKIVQPLQQMRKVMRVSGEADDILDMSAGLLARRLTSFAQSNPQIKAILSAMDKATKISGKTRLNVETLQDFYNILEKYYDIAPKTGFQAQVKAGVEKAVGGPIKYLGEQVGGLVGETPAVGQKALEKILEEILK